MVWFLKFFKKKVAFCIFKQKFNFWCCVQKNGFDSLSRLQKGGSILWVIKKFNSLNHIQKNVHFFESISKEKFNSLSHTGKQDRFNSLSHVGKQERFNSSRHIEKKDFNSLSQIEKRFIEAQFYESFKKSSILWVIFFFLKKKRFRFFESLFLTQSSILWIILVKKEEVQFCKSY